MATALPLSTPEALPNSMMHYTSGSQAMFNDVLLTHVFNQHKRFWKKVNSVCVVVICCKHEQQIGIICLVTGAPLTNAYVDIQIYPMFY